MIKFDWTEEEKKQYAPDNEKVILYDSISRN